MGRAGWTGVRSQLGTGAPCGRAWRASLRNEEHGDGMSPAHVRASRRVTTQRRTAMTTDRRDFLKAAGAIGSIAATSAAFTGGASVAHAAPPRTGARGMAHGLTLLTLRRNGEYRL